MLDKHMLRWKQANKQKPTNPLKTQKWELQHEEVGLIKAEMHNIGRHYQK